MHTLANALLQTAAGNQHGGGGGGGDGSHGGGRGDDDSSDGVAGDSASTGTAASVVLPASSPITPSDVVVGRHSRTHHHARRGAGSTGVQPLLLPPLPALPLDGVAKDDYVAAVRNFHKHLLRPLSADRTQLLLAIDLLVVSLLALGGCAMVDDVVVAQARGAIEKKQKPRKKATRDARRSSPARSATGNAGHDDDDDDDDD
eukprot:CAMPEP_0198368726 /NCGR_PEP_ID=MMETSP1450-20131203/155846_1 /TAXON_ID=753684 ORGANISM="Madagascaria erythrocladiodes, Strain CCMP3234" /NCGR_SAMPLE_ID=MMETSP1450 /ASSEMBLY_ACC=CAM_ASM_001115 /LENGTH=201 /DNA_ID=CAMNT_0044076235 /DNA_START=431 /DNA_END=1033 /DNA_ORIENTATION=+